MDLRIGTQHCWIEHERVTSIWKKFDELRELRSSAMYPTDIQHLMLIGPGGVGKSTLARKYQERYPMKRLEEKHQRQVVYMELPEPFTLGELYSSLIETLGGTRIGGGKIGDLKRRAVHHLTNQDVELLFLDEAQYIFTSRSVKPYEAMETMKHLANICNVVLVLIGNPEIIRLRGYNLQYRRRFAPYRLERFMEVDDEFCHILHNFQSLSGFSDLNRIWDIETGIPQVIYKMSYGIIDIVKKILIEAALVLEAKGDNNLTVDVLEKAYKNFLASRDDGDIEAGINSDSVLVN